MTFWELLHQHWSDVSLMAGVATPLCFYVVLIRALMRSKT